jgi:hypothetical protein
MANKVVWLNYRLSSLEEQTTYAEMVRLSHRSAERYLDGDWDAELLVGDWSHLPFDEAVSRMYRQLFRHLRRRHAEGHNVLHLDPDVALVKPTRIFGRFREMRLFWHTDPAKRGQYDPYLNGGVVYLPASMDGQLWRFARRPLREWNHSQDVLNRMFYAQQPVPGLHPELNWSPNVPAPIAARDAHLIHLNATRGPEQAHDWLRALVI